MLCIESRNILKSYNKNDYTYINDASTAVLFPKKAVAFFLIVHGKRVRRQLHMQDFHTDLTYSFVIWIARYLLEVKSKKFGQTMFYIFVQSNIALTVRVQTGISKKCMVWAAVWVLIKYMKLSCSKS